VLNIEPHEWEFATGVLTAETRKEIGLDRVQMWVDDTQDGGCAKWLCRGKGEGIMKATNRESEDISIEQVREMKKQAIESIASDGGKLEGSCKCGKVQFYITRPKDSEGTGKRRYKALVCPCTSCRLTTGFEITAWATIPRSNLFSLDGKLLDLAGVVEGCVRYESSPDVDRFFCRECGATAFFWDHRLEGSERAKEVDVAAGLLRSKRGVLAEDWLEWKREVKYVEDAIDSEFVEGFVRALGEV
jgi:hypothetical protein